jgi:uncharacterized protein involved in exopolysaccharide biosynthesis
MSAEFNTKDVKGMLRRRARVFLTSSLLVFFVCVFVAFYLPPIYRSEATIVIESQEIPEEYVKSTITTYVEQRLQTISQEVMSRAKLNEMIQQYNLYPELALPGDKLKQMRKDINLETTDMTFQDERTGRLKRIISSFKLSYVGKDPETVSKITTLLTNLFIEEDLRSRTASAVTTSDFLEKELESLKKEVAAFEAKISRFKSANIDALPGSTGINLQTITYLNQDLQRVNTQMRALREKKIYLEAQIVNVEPLTPLVTEAGVVSSNPAERLKYLRTELVRKQASLTPKHPDIRALMNEIKELESQVGRAYVPDEKQKVLKQLDTELSELEGKLGANHPDVIRLAKEVQLLSRDVNRQDAVTAINRYSEESPDNPAYLNLRAQIIAASAELDSLAEDRAKIERELEDTRKKIQMIPLVEEDYSELTLNYESSKRKYQEVLNKLQSAKMAQEMDVSQRGERFKVIEPAYLPLQPYKPNRILIMLIGLVLGLSMGLGLAVFKETVDQSIKSSDEIEQLLGVPVIASVSLFVSEHQKKMYRMKRLVQLSTVVLVLACGSFIIDRYVMPLDALWSTFEDRLVEMGIPIEKEPLN